MVVDADAAMEAAHHRVKTATLQELIEQVTHLPAAILRTHQTLSAIFLSHGDAHRPTAILPGEGGHHNAHWKLRDSTSCNPRFLLYMHGAEMDELELHLGSPRYPCMPPLLLCVKTRVACH